MKALVLLLGFLALDAQASQRMVNRYPNYFPSFGIGSTQSATYTTVGGSVSIVSTVGKATELVRILSTTDAHIAIGNSPTVTVADMPIIANTEVILELAVGQTVSAIQKTAAGNLYVTHLKFFPED